MLKYEAQKWTHCLFFIEVSNHLRPSYIVVPSLLRLFFAFRAEVERRKSEAAAELPRLSLITTRNVKFDSYFNTYSDPATFLNGGG